MGHQIEHLLGNWVSQNEDTSGELPTMRSFATGWIGRVLVVDPPNPKWVLLRPVGQLRPEDLQSSHVSG